MFLTCCDKFQSNCIMHLMSNMQHMGKAHIKYAHTQHIRQRQCYTAQQVSVTTVPPLCYFKQVLVKYAVMYENKWILGHE